MTPDPAALTQFLIIVGFLASIVANLVMIRGSNRAQKREVSFADQFATAKEHAALAAEVAKLDSERRTSVANLHQKIDDLATRIDARIDEIPGRTIALLNETKQLHRQ